MRTLLLTAALVTTTAAQAAPLGGPVLFRDDMTTPANWVLVRSPTGGRAIPDSAAIIDDEDLNSRYKDGARTYLY